MAYKKFSTWLEDMEAPLGQEDLAGETPSEPNIPEESPQIIGRQKATPGRKAKPWKANKKQVLQFWKNLNPNSQLQVRPIPASHKGSTMQEDSVRVTGSKEFIASVISHLKDFIRYENPNLGTKVVVQYRQSARSLIPGAKDSYMIYITIRERGA
jgi:hypothetical protein